MSHNHNVTAMLRSFVERIERLNDEKAAISDDLKSVFAEAKARGLNVKALRAIIKLRKMDRADVEEQSYWINAYAETLGMYQPDLFGIGDLDDPEKAKARLFDGFRQYVRRNPGTDITFKTADGDFEKITSMNSDA